jgi:hypothetical protein
LSKGYPPWPLTKLSLINQEPAALNGRIRIILPKKIKAFFNEAWRVALLLILEALINFKTRRKQKVAHTHKTIALENITHCASPRLQSMPPTSGK